MNNADASKQIQQMIGFIRQKTQGKPNEISVSVEEEFVIEKLQLVEAERTKYDRKVKQVEVKKKA